MAGIIQGQFDDRLAVLEQFLARDAPAIQEEQRRQEEEEEDLGIERDPPVRGQPDERAKSNLKQRPGQGQGQHSGQNTAQDHREQQKQDDRDDFQQVSSILASGRLSACGRIRRAERGP
jgi:hypothetical protein